MILFIIFISFLFIFVSFFDNSLLTSVLVCLCPIDSTTSLNEKQFKSKSSR